MNRISQQLWWLTAASLAMMALGAIWAGFETRVYQDTLVWVKPFKFALSFVVFFATLAWAAAGLSAQIAQGRALRWMVAYLAASFWFEMIYIAMQAAQGQASHFNDTSLFHGVMYSVMGFGATLLMVGTAQLGWALVRDHASAYSADLRFGIAVGFILSAVLTLITAFTLGSNGGHFIGVQPAGGASLPFFGWSAEVGDLRPAHFLALHAMQVIPLLAWARQGKARARVWIGATAVVYSVVTLAVYAQALMGLPMIRL